MSYALALALLVVLAAACGGGPASPAPGPSTATPADTVTPAVEAPPAARPPASLPGVAPTAISVAASISASCRSTASQAQVSVTYSVRALGDARLQRVRLMDDGRIVDDSGPISEAAFGRTVSLDVPPGTRHVYQVSIEPAANSNSRATVSCS